MPAGNDGYKCFGLHVPSDEYLTGFRFAAASPVQNEVLLTVSNAPVPAGSFDCNPGSVGPELIYAASVGTTSIAFPSGFGVHVSAGQYLLLNVHLVNLADTSVTDSTRLEARVGVAADVTTPIDMTLAGTYQINIPNDGQLRTATGGCVAASDTHVLAFLPLMRSRGVHQSVEILADTTSQVAFDQDFNWLHDTYTFAATPLLIPAGARITTQCSYINAGPHTVNYGETADQESCFSAIYRYPISSAGTFNACADVGGSTFDFTRE